MNLEIALMLEDLFNEDEDEDVDEDVNENEDEEEVLRVERAIVSQDKQGMPLSILLWDDGTKTKVRCSKEDNYNKELGLMLCVVKKMLPYSVYRSYCELLESKNPVAEAKEFILSHIEYINDVDQHTLNNFLQALESENRKLETARLIAQHFIPCDYKYLKRQARRK